MVRWRTGHALWALLLLSHVVLPSPVLRPALSPATEDVAPFSLQTQPFVIESQVPMFAEEEVFGPELETRGVRDKRTARVVLDLLFWKFNTLLDFKTRFLAQISNRQRFGGRSGPTPAPDGVSTTTEDIPEFDSNRVMLDIPGEVFGTAFTVVTDVSKIVGDVILNTARRTQRFIEALKPALARAFGYKISALAGGSSSSTRVDGESEAPPNDV